MNEIVVVGIGNPYRGDDGAGWIVIDLLKERTSLPLIKQRGDIAQLLDIFSRYKSVYIVDACIDSTEEWQRLDLLTTPIEQERTQTSTHGFGLTQALSLAKNLDQLPEKLILYAIKGENYTVTQQLSKQVSKNIDIVVQAIVEELTICTNRA